MGSGSPDQLADPALVQVFWALQLTGCAVFMFMLISALAFRSSVKRHPIWFNFCLAFIVYSLSYSLLVLSGHANDSSDELAGTGICIGQAALIYAAPFLAPSASAILIAMLLLNIVSKCSSLSQKTSRVCGAIALACPWVLWSGVLTGALIYILRDISMVALSPNGTYCVVNRPVLPRVSAAAATFFTLLTLILEISVAFRIYRHREQLPGALSHSIPVVIRISILTAAAVAAVLTGLMCAGLPDYQPILDIMIGMVPFVISIAFVTQQDVWERYLFWKKSQGQTAHDGHEDFRESQSFSLAAIIESSRSTEKSWRNLSSLINASSLPDSEVAPQDRQQPLSLD